MKQAAVFHVRFGTWLEKFTLALVLACFYGSAWADKLALDLQTAVKMAIEKGARVSVKNAALLSREFDLTAAKTAWRPTITAQASSQYGSGQPTSFFALQGISETDAPLKKSSGKYASGSLALTLPLYQKDTWFHGNTPEAQQAQANLGKAEADLAQIVAEISTQTAKLYFLLLQDKEELSLRQSAHEESVRLRDYIAPRVKAGIVGMGEMLSAVSMVAANLAASNNAKHKFALDMALFHSLLALEPQVTVEIDQINEWSPELPELPEVLKEAFLTEPGIKGAESEVELAQAKANDARAQSSPTLALTSSAIAASNLSDNETPSFVSIGLAFSMPLLDFGANSEKVKAKEQGVMESKLKVVEQKETVKQNVLNAYYAVTLAIENLEPLRAKMSYAEYQRQLFRERFTKGLVGLDEMVRIADVSYSAQIEFIRARYSAWSSYADLHQMVGKPYGEMHARGKGISQEKQVDVKVPAANQWKMDTEAETTRQENVN